MSTSKTFESEFSEALKVDKRQTRKLASDLYYFQNRVIQKDSKTNRLFQIRLLNLSSEEQGERSKIINQVQAYHFLRKVSIIKKYRRRASLKELELSQYSSPLEDFNSSYS